jgi:hypothetical protein
MDTPFSKLIALILLLCFIGSSLGWWFTFQKAAELKRAAIDTVPQKIENAPAPQQDNSVVTYVDQNHQFISRFRMTTPCEFTGPSFQACNPVQTIDSSFASKTTPVVSFTEDTVTAAVYSSPQTLTGSTKIGTYQFGGKTATVYLKVERGYEFYDQMYMLAMPTAKNRWLNITFQPDELDMYSEGTFAEFEKYMAQQTEADNLLLHSFYFLDEQSVTATSKNWQKVAVDSFQLPLPKYAEVTDQSDSTLEVTFPRSKESSRNTIIFAVFSLEELDRSGTAASLQEAVEITYSLQKLTSTTTKLANGMTLYHYETSSNIKGFIIDEVNQKVLVVKSAIDPIYEATFMGMLTGL